MRCTHYMREKIVRSALTYIYCRHMSIPDAVEKAIKELNKYLGTDVDITSNDMMKIHNKIVNSRYME